MNNLSINIAQAGYDKKIILKGVSISIERGTISAFIGPNGAGKSTLLKAIMGMLDFAERNVQFDGEDISKAATDTLVRNGIGFVPQGNKVFSDMTVKENLEIGGYIIKDKKELRTKIEEVLNLFPSLKDRLKQDAGDLSGGEKQQLALARALVSSPRVLLLDEPSLGLSPQLVNFAFNTIQEINAKFGTTILIVEQKVREVLKIAHKVYALKLGQIVFEGTPEELEAGEKLKEIFLV